MNFSHLSGCGLLLLLKLAMPWLWVQMAKLGKEAVVGSKREGLAVTLIGYGRRGVALGPVSGEAGQPPGPPEPV